MRIKDRPEFQKKLPVMTFSPNDTVYDAVRSMSEKNFGSAVVVDKENVPVGIVTERDFMRRLLYKNLDQKKTKLSDIMTTELRLAKEDDNLLEWLREMSNERFRHLPVVDDAGKLIGLMSQGDFVSFTWPELFARVKEQAKATFEVNPSIFAALGAAIVIMLVTLLYLVSSIN